ncbi:CBS domain-containing protein [Pseudonocardia phyllosphaerae]|uniref:CBS domain-containing protein n=1 Tax=Pseudonocardia phyllosphaerae TaxID=3390502 RepID=UPI0039785D0B
MVLRARDVMTERVVSVWADAPLSRARDRMAEFRYSALPVVDRRYALVGMISLVDVLRHRDDPDATVADAMTVDVVWLRPGSTLTMLAQEMRSYGELRVVPIVDRDILVGVVTRSDVLRGAQDDSRVGRATRWLRGKGTTGGTRPEALAPRGAGRIHGRDMTTLTVADVMTDHGLVTVSPWTPVEEVADTLLAFRYTALPVVLDDGRLDGIVSEADLMSGALQAGRRSRPRTAAEVMTRDIEVLGPDEPLLNAEGLLVKRGFRVVPVIDDRDRLIGMISRSDLL